MAKIFAVVAVVVASWAALLAALWLLRPRGVDFAEAKRFVPDLIDLVRKLRRDPGVARSVQIRLVLLLLYLALPVDVVPDFVPVLGYADDIIVVALTLRSVVRRAGAHNITRHWRGSETGRSLLLRLAGER